MTIDEQFQDADLNGKSIEHGDKQYNVNPLNINKELYKIYNNSEPIETPARDLHEICLKTGRPMFKTTLLDIEYCALKPTQSNVRCPMRSPFIDHNGMFECMYNKYRNIMEE